MKQIALRTGDFKTTDIIKTVIERSGSGGIAVDEMRARCRVLDALDKPSASGPLLLEDADHKTLVTALKGFAFGMASRELLAIIDDILNASDVSLAAAHSPQ